MSKDRLQTISTYLDGECSDTERRSTDHLLADETHRGFWWRYHLIGDVMRGDVPRYTDRGFAVRVSAAIADEPTVLAPARRSPTWLRPVAGAAVAASVAMVAVWGVRNAETTRDTDPTPPGMELAQTPEATPIPAPALQTIIAAAPMAQPVMAVIKPDLQWFEFDTAAEAAAPLPSSRSRLNSYLLNYSEQRAMMGSPAVLPYVKVVGYEPER